MSEPEPSETSFALDCEGIRLFLRRLPQPDPDEDVVPVLLVHGASACSDSFLIPGPEEPGEPRSLAGWLHGRGFEPWLLDWRGSARVVKAMSTDELGRLRHLFDLDHAAAEDLPRALHEIHRVRPNVQRIAAVGHCMGAGVLAHAIAAGHLQKYPLKEVVLLTLGLFYEPPFESRLKTQDHLLERYLDPCAGVLGVDPRDDSDWPPQLLELYSNWPVSLRPHPGSELSRAEQMCNRLSFMYGTPYYGRNLVPEVHGERSGADGALLAQFGPIPLRLYAHAARNARRGWAAEYEPRDERQLLGPESRARFDRLERVTLITGQKNQLWHRNSIDRMYEWLTRGKGRPGRRVHKWVLPDYGHQDLLWGRETRSHVFPKILDGLRPRAAEDELEGPLPHGSVHPPEPVVAPRWSRE